MERYSNKRFHLALSDILREKNIKLRGLAGRTNLNYTYFSKLKSRKKSPPIRTIEIIARGLGVHPEYFLEYRIDRITCFLYDNPEFIGPLISYMEELKNSRILRVAESDEPFKD